MNKSNLIHGLLSNALNTFATGQSVNVVWEGRPEDPSQVLYLREWLIMGRGTGLCLGPTAPNAAPGIYQVDVVDSVSEWGTAYTMANDLLTAFYRGSTLTTTGVRILIETGQTGPGMRIDSKYVLPVTIPFTAHVTL